jgi:sterol desaturase/sphingolipid hydroxylase (fatty acid hydroxylase superfamily)
MLYCVAAAGASRVFASEQMHVRARHNITAPPMGVAIPAATREFAQEMTMSLGTILLIVLGLMLLGAIPAWPHSRGWGYAPSGGLGLVLVVVVVLLLMGRI